MINEAYVCSTYLALHARAQELGITIEISGYENFQINHSDANGLIFFVTLKELEIFIRGYELCNRTKIK